MISYFRLRLDYLGEDEKMSSGVKKVLGWALALAVAVTFIIGVVAVIRHNNAKLAAAGVEAQKLGFTLTSVRERQNPRWDRSDTNIIEIDVVVGNTNICVAELQIDDRSNAMVTVNGHTVQRYEVDEFASRTGPRSKPWQELDGMPGEGLTLEDIETKLRDRSKRDPSRYPCFS